MEKTNKITYSLIDQYLRGDLSGQDMHELERKALEDPFLAEAIEGYTNTELSQTAQLSILQRQLEERIALQQERKNVYHFTWQRISIAAAAGLLFILASILFWMKGSTSFQLPGEKEVQVSLPPKGSAATGHKAAVEEPADNVQASPEPLEGWGKYKQYLHINRRKLSSTNQTAKVKLQFFVSAKGKPEEFVILEGVNEQVNNEAIRLIKAGPAFKTGMPGSVQVEIDFKR